MKVIFLAFKNEGGGAVHAMQRLAAALGYSGVDIDMLVRRQLSNSQDVSVPQAKFNVFQSKLRSYLGKQIFKLQKQNRMALASANWLPSRLSRLANRSSADLVHLHWIGNETLSIEDVARLRKPTVMTLHDMWGFCGTEHYTPFDQDCRWQEGYTRSNKPQELRGLDIDHWTWQRKRRAWKRGHIICPSSWLANCACQSALMANWDIHIIPHALDLQTFKPLSKEVARDTFGLPQNKRIILFGRARSAGDWVKGIDLLTAAIRESRSVLQNTLVVVFGQDRPTDSLQGNAPAVHSIGPLYDKANLARLYNAADVMVVPSRREAFGQTASEAQACGTPVVAFNASRLKDIVVHYQTGYLAEPFSTTDLAAGIDWILGTPERFASLGKAARQRANTLWHPETVASQHLEVYRQATACS
jgi:glycosyltransferase involved in cell wall biosynthesis